MSDTQEKSDDLIAELAKLMASNAQGSEGTPKPTVIKLPPLNEATIQATPVRIPGMEPPKAEPRPAPAPVATAPTVRIPGMQPPAGVATVAAPPPAPKPAAIDMGRPMAAPAIATEPLANWQNREIPKISIAPASSIAAPVAEMKFEPARPTVPAPTARLEPSVGAPVVSPPAAAAAKDGATGGDFDFDFGFGSGTSGGDAPADQPADDPIADLIAAELDAAESVPRPEPKVVAAPATTAAVPVQTQQVVARTAVPQRAAVAPVTVKPVSVTPRGPEADRFAVAPVFGFNAKAAAAAATTTPAQVPARSERVTPQPQAAPAPQARPTAADPMDEIEGLIGDAVRVELDRPTQRAPKPAAAAPVVPPLSSGFAPRRSGIKDTDPAVQSAEAAILAAAAVSGDDRRVQAPQREERPKRMKVKPPKTSFVSSGARQYVGIAVAGTLLLAAGFGLYWVLGMNRADPTTAPVLAADATPAKVEPSVAVASTAEPPARSVVFDGIEGAATAAVGETLVSRDETAGVDVAEVARVVTPVAEEEPAGGLANRKVRTVTVRPDGTIVSGDDAVAGAAALPVGRPNVPEIPGAEIEPSELLTAAVAESQASASLPATAGDASDPIAALVADTAPATTTPLTDVQPTETEVASVVDSQVEPVFDGSIVAPIPMTPARYRTASAVPLELLTVEEAAAAQAPVVAAAAPEPTRAVDASDAAAYVQLASVPSEADAEGQVQAQTSRYGDLFGGGQLIVQRADLGAKGVKYRVRLPVGSLQDATRICASIKASGGDCFATNS